MGYRIRLHNFEGPLDLLLFFIKRDELDIYDIPISHITKEFLEYIRFMKMYDLELAGEFLVMAAMLMQIKAKMMLPKEETTEEGEEPEDPRTELTMRLLEYKRYKEVSEELHHLSEEQAFTYFREYYKADTIAADTADSLLSHVTLMHLLKAFQKALANAPKPPPTHNIEQYSVTIEDQCEIILQRVYQSAEITFSELISDYPKIIIVVTFLALLELVRSNSIAIRQSDCFDDILLFRTN